MSASGYSVNSTARALKSGIGQAIGVVVLDVANPFWGEVIKGVETVTSAGQIPLIIGSSNEDAGTERRILESFESQGVRGVLVAPTHANLPTLRRFQAKGIKVVLLDKEDPEGEFPSMSLDHAAGAATAARFLLDGGHRRFALVNGSPDISWCSSRSRGFHAECGGVAGAVVQEFNMSAMTVEEGWRSVSLLLAVEPAVTAVFCANDMLALGVLKGLAQRGIEVPRQMSVVGYDDAMFSELLSPGLTTVRQSAADIGRQAGLLIAPEFAPAEERGVLPHPRLVVRGSARALS
ncbi:MAG: HTH-type transcriptional repressor CytR [Xylophilus sp.]|nr:MAG: HTH-type transcriptional repressor CytR [Xylophilus sp.]